jgi:alpha-L-rhamnosidase
MDIQKSEQHIYSTDMTFLNQAEAIKQELIHSVHHARHQVTLSRNPECVHGWQCLPAGDIQALAQRSLHKGDSCIVDFGDHQVGYVSLQIRPVGSPPDAPLHLRLTFGEMPVELAEPFAGYDGWVSSSWLQEETLHIDVLPCLLRLPRRYSFRYLKLEILDTSPKYGVAFEQIQCDTVSSADVASVLPLPTNDPMLTALDRISMKTLHDCMQQVFEDGPKRDRRLWLGDLRLQALANYQTFRNYDLVRRCLYLFAAVTNEQGQVSANVFVAPCLIPDDTYLYDYSLFFVVSLFDYYQETADRETLTALWPTACRQIELALARVDARGLVRDATDGTWWALIGIQSSTNRHRHRVF